MKDIKNYEGLYAVTSCGKVWSYRSQKFLKGIPDKDGYLRVTLVKDKQKRNFFIHRLVAEAYISNPNNLPQINHCDECKHHNYINNLEWVTAKTNANYGSRNKRISKPVYCVELNKTFESQTMAANALGVDVKGISKCCLGVYQTSGGYHWRQGNE